ncbi:phospholipase D/transphosphatidylase [Gracilibacillus halophilus YIM-C55.5]|uniref:Cardiolipin synthase n=1 Tax=Gracilibacillus halophilus YIM-C55.5 TaxID=1308866 RepID=N4WA65_9BACI|nr:cardiolipin synthase [Gracilibacillus halophilus]ENH96154.1 phospholipase D/transphosphatidylase [Gracilibacillus halophilus YIM-C55.5]
MLVVGMIVFLIIFIYIDFRLGMLLYRKRDRSFIATSDHSDVTLYASGEPLFRQMKRDLRKANQTIDMQFYTIRNDKISQQLYQVLDEKHKEGITIRMLVDWAGSFSFSKKWVNDRFTLKKTNQPSFPWLFSLQQRNHRKLTIIDDDISYLGGFNVGDEYIDKDNKLGTWRDYHLRIRGPLTQHLQHSFYRDWKEANEQQHATDIHQQLQTCLYQEDPLIVLSTDGHQLEEAFLILLQQANDSIVIGSPYFIPTKRVLQALFSAIHRGVAVTVIIPEKGDHLLTKAGAFPFLQQMLDVGADVYLYLKGFFHGKVCMIDDKFCDIGTANFDQRSLLLNQEINLIVKRSHPLFADIERVIKHDMANSKRLTNQWLKQQPLFMKLLSKLTALFRPLL